MIYRKPEVETFSEAVRVIENIMAKPPALVAETVLRHANPTYDLDE